MADTPPKLATDAKKDPESDVLPRPTSLDDSLHKGEVFSLESVDPALNAKMHLVNNVRSIELRFRVIFFCLSRYCARLEFELSLYMMRIRAFCLCLAYLIAHTIPIG